jgi:hypothetical protein
MRSLRALTCGRCSKLLSKHVQVSCGNAQVACRNAIVSRPVLTTAKRWRGSSHFTWQSVKNIHFTADSDRSVLRYVTVVIFG